MSKEKISTFLTNLAMLLALESYSPEKTDSNLEIKENVSKFKLMILKIIE